MMAEEDKEAKKPEEQQPTEGPTEEAKDEAPNPEKGDDKSSKSSSAHKDDCRYYLYLYIQHSLYLVQFPPS